ncbi:MAG: M3 family metallopeptidase [Bacteroidetes bacterium]|nr:M3 family metallopeptidase [Bacteroidota bacterium]
MKKLLLILIIFMTLIACSETKKSKERENPFFTEYETPFGIPPFNEIKHEDYLPAFIRGIEEQIFEINAIVSNTQIPDFENVIEDFERSGNILMKVSSVFYNLNASLTNDTMQELARQISPLLSKHSDDITLNPGLFKKVEEIYLQREHLQLSPEQSMLLDKTYKRFIRGGAMLDSVQQDKLRKINEELSLLSLHFGENLLAETNKYKLIITDIADLDGIPEAFLMSAAEAATNAGLSSSWMFTLQNPSIIPVLQYAKNRNLREQIFKANISKGDNNDENDNKKILSRTAALRVERAKLLGYENHAAFVLEQNMAKDAETVINFLNDLISDAMPMAKKEAELLQEMIYRSGENFKLQPWDWWYFAEILRKEKYDLDENQLRPYFKLENVRDGVFALAGKLWGLKFIERSDLPKYHPDVMVYEVTEEDGNFIGIMMMDFYPRESKRGGAWMSSFRKQYYVDSQRISPIVTTNFNFTAPSADQPALLSWEEVETLFHEFGHALHGLLSDTKYNSLSGTSVPRDFVELPSQIMENWASEPDVLALYAFHYQTAELIPQDLVQKMINSGTFNQGFAMAEFLSAALLDMDWHTLTVPKELDVDAFEAESVKKSGLIDEIVLRYRSTYFSHIFSGGYSSGYYSYVWSEVLDADAFEAFKENGLFDKNTASLFRKHILEKGGTIDPMQLYVGFRGKEPDRSALLRKRGLR